MHLKLFGNIKVEYLRKFQSALKLITMWKYLGGDKRMEDHIGLEEIHGAHLGESQDFLEFRRDPIT